MWMRWWLTIGGCLAGFAGAQAQDPLGDVAAGRELAATVCSACHAVDKGVRDATPGGPPAFQSLADDPAMTEIALRVFLRTPHRNMPNLMLADSEIDDVVAYIHSLRRDR